MEKRTLLALLLSIAVLFLWESLFSPPTPQKQSGESTHQSSSETPKKDMAADEKISPEIIPEASINKMAEGMKKWLVSTRFYETQILERGARVFSIKLKNHKESLGKDAPFMDLVTSQKLGFLPFTLDLLEHKDWHISDINFTGPSEEVIDVGVHGSKEVVYRGLLENKLEVTKIYKFDSDSYVVDVTLRVKNLLGDALKDRLGISFYFVPYQTNEPSFNESTVAYYGNKAFNVLTLKDLKKEVKTLTVPLDWVGYQNNYFLQAFAPVPDEAYQIVARLVDEQKKIVQVVYLSENFVLEPQTEKSWRLSFYAGPKELSELKKAGHKLVASIDYGWVGFIAKPLLHLLKWLYSFTHNYGIAIIILTIIVKIVCLPLTHKSYQSMKKMKQIQPLIAQIREKYKNDREKLNQELLMLYRTYKVNPMGGCLPILLQIPVFFALYRMLYSAVELRHQPFCLWINDLTAPDRLSVGFSIPYLGGVPVLTILMGVSMFVQQKMTPSTGDPRQDKMMLLMPVIFTVLFVNFPSGLVLYWFVNNILSIAQQYWIDRAKHAGAQS